MPRTFDEHFRPVIEVNDPGAPPNRGGIIVAPYGKGLYVYTTLAFFRQLPAGVTGAAKLFVNLISSEAKGVTQTQTQGGLAMKRWQIAVLAIAVADRMLEGRQDGPHRLLASRQGSARLFRD